MIFGPRLEIKTPEQIRVMRRSGLVTASALEAARSAIRPGVTTAEVDAAAAAAITRGGAVSNFLGYHGFPAVSCISVNEEAVHGIPGDRVLQAGDIVTVDCGCHIDGWHSDAAITVPVSGAADADLRLIAQAEAAMWAGIAAFASAERTGEIGAAIEDHVAAHAPDLEILEDYTGHGIGTAMHLDPDVPNYRTSDRGPKIKPGLCLAIEPMLVTGSGESDILDDDWTVVTADGGRAAQVEHTVARHEGGIWVLTARDGGAAGLAPHGITPVTLD